MPPTRLLVHKDQEEKRQGLSAVRRRNLLIVCGAIVLLAPVLIAIAYVIQAATGGGPLGGPVVIVGGDLLQHGFLGLHFVKPTSPLTIQSVLAGSGAADAGLQPDDVILAVGDFAKPTFSELHAIVQSTAPGDELLLTIRRDEDTIESRVTLISFREMIALRELHGAEGGNP